MNWNKIKTLVLSALGVATLADSKLTAEQEETIKGCYGENVLEKFKAGLAAENPEDHASAVHAAMREFFAPEATQATNEVAEQLQAAQQTIANQNRTIAALMDSAEDTPSAETPAFAGKAGVAKVLNVARQASHYAAAFAFLDTGSALSAKGKTIDVDQLRSEFGTYLSQNNNNLTIARQIFTGFTSSEHFRSVPAVTEYRAVQAQINSVVQQFKPKWTPQGNVKFTPLTIKNYRHKVNVPIIPAEVLDSYLFFLYDESLAPDQMPITKYIWEQLVYPKILDDIETRMIFKGKYDESADADAATAPEESMDGILTQLIEEKASGTSRINFFDQTIDWSTATDAQIVNFINAFADWVDDADIGATSIACSRFVKRRYQRAYENLYGTGNKQVGGLNKGAEVDYVELELVDLKGMKGSPIIFATSPGNLVKLRHKNEVPFVINDVQKHNYEVRLFGEFWLGAGFEIAELTYAYVPDSYTDAQVDLKDFREFPDGTAPEADDAGSGAGGL